jgi:hypothetical protein
VKRRRGEDEELTVVDHYIPTSVGDLSHPNATLGIAIAADSPRYRVEEESFFATTETNPFRLKVGESRQILRLKEAGEVISIEIISDNPFLQVHLEIDDYRSDEKGITAAELLETGRTTYANMEFSAKKLPSGDYSLVYAPRTNVTYTDSLKLKLINSLTDLNEQGLGSFFIRQFSNPQLRGSLPKLSTRSYLGGTYVDIPQIQSVPQFGDDLLVNGIIASALARGLDWDLYDNQYNNESAVADGASFDAVNHRFNTAARGLTQTTMTSLNPYTGNTGRLHLVVGTGEPTAFWRIVFFPKGQAASTTAGALPPDPNFQHIAIYAATSLTESTESESSVTGDIMVSEFIEQAIYVRDKGRVYFPGSVITISQYKSSTGAFVTDGSGNGAYILMVNSGLDFVPEKIGIGGPLISGPPSLAGFGRVQVDGLNSEISDNGMIVRKIIVKRKRKKSLV